jgi:hypothetical protein
LIRDVLLVLFFSLVLQWIWLITVPSVFIQYYLPINWIIATLAGLGLSLLLETKSEKNIVSIGIYGGVFLFFGVFAYGNFKTNMFRGNIRSTDTVNRLLSLWKAIPEESAVFPSVLFRPIVYPPMPYQVYATELPSSILARFPKVKDLLEEKHVRYIYNATRRSGVYSVKVYTGRY